MPALRDKSIKRADKMRYRIRKIGNEVEYADKDKLFFNPLKYAEAVYKTDKVMRNVFLSAYATVGATRNKLTGKILLNIRALQQDLENMKRNRRPYHPNLLKTSFEDMFSLAVSHEIIHDLLVRLGETEASDKFDRLTVRQWKAGLPLTMVNLWGEHMRRKSPGLLRN